MALATVPEADEYSVRYNRVHISKALLTARRLLKGPVHPAATIAEILSPYMDCTEVGGVTDPLEEKEIRSSIFALMGDAYRRGGGVQLAAQWYRRASLISSGGHATTYADMVCKHQLVEFYNDALATLEEHQRRWMAKPMIVRFRVRIAAWLRSDADGRAVARAERGNLDFLRQHAALKAA